MEDDDSATTRLELGDRVTAARLDEGLAEADAARREGVTPAVAKKARWLARTYTRAERVDIGPTALAALTASHLEAAASASRAERVRILREAAGSRMSVRALKAALPRTRPGATGTESAITVLGAASELDRVGGSLERYATFSERQLQMLLNGPHGQVIRRLAAAGQALAARIPCPNSEHS